ncbi:MAG: zinc finger domain-containing protein, partial [Promethearchaeota archaeon]
MPVKQQRCTGCGQLIHPTENAVSFPCPQCGDTWIWRCEKCRKFAHPYKCINCSF